MLPLQKLEDTDDLMNQPPEDDYLLFSTSESNKKKQIKTNKNKQKRLPSDYDNDFVL